MKSPVCTILFLLWIGVFLFSSCLSRDALALRTADGNRNVTESCWEEFKISQARDEDGGETAVLVSEEGFFRTEDVSLFLAHYRFPDPPNPRWPISNNERTVKEIRIFHQDNERVLLFCRDSLNYMHWMKLCYEEDGNGGRFLVCADDLVGRSPYGDFSYSAMQAYPLLREFYDLQPALFEWSEEKERTVVESCLNFLQTVCNMPDLTKEQLTRLLRFVPLPFITRLYLPLRENRQPEEVIPFVIVLDPGKYDVGLSEEKVDEIESILCGRSGIGLQVGCVLYWEDPENPENHYWTFQLENL